MKIKFLLLLLLLSSINLFSQSKYYIYFKDKEIGANGVLNKTSAAFFAAEKELTPAAIERRIQVMGENYITEEDLPVSQKYIKGVEALGIKIENKLKWFNAVTAYLNDDQLNQISKLSFVEKLEPVRSTMHVKPIESNQSIPTNSLQKTGSQTSLNYGSSLTQNSLSDVPAVHDLGITGKGVLIGMLDTGFRWKNHPALKNLKIVYEYDYLQKDSVTANQTTIDTQSGQDSHGTHCLGLMAGNAPGNLIGPAFDATILLAKTEDVSTGNSDRRYEEDAYVAALQDFEALGVQITTSSLGYTEFIAPEASYTFNDMNGKTTIVAKGLNLAFDRGVFTLSAAGNERGNSWGHIVSPADAFNVIAVGAVTSANTISSFSSPGPSSDGRIKPEIAAMGTNDYYSHENGGYGTGNGTSYATPIAAGIAGLLKSCWPHLTNVQMRKTFLESGDNTATPNNDRGYGLISAKKAIAYPNLQLTNGQYKLNKIFINAAGVNSSSVKLNYKIGSGSIQSTAMNYDGTLKYNFTLPSSVNGTLIEFYFEYNTTAGALVREPVSANYKFTFGSLIVNNVFTDVNDIKEIPTEFSLSQNYPNPFNPSTRISYKVKAASQVTLKVFDMLGREVATLVDENKQPGIYSTEFRAQSAGLASGIYFYTLHADGFVQTKKMLLMK